MTTIVSLLASCYRAALQEDRTGSVGPDWLPTVEDLAFCAAELGVERVIPSHADILAAVASAAPAKISATFFSDPGHGWLRMRLSDAKALGLAPSQFSFRRGLHVYLEEDVDAGAAFDAAKRLGYEIRVRTAPPSQRESKIRTYDRCNRCAL